MTQGKSLAATIAEAKDQTMPDGAEDVIFDGGINSYSHSGHSIYTCKMSSKDNTTIKARGVVKRRRSELGKNEFRGEEAKGTLCASPDSGAADAPRKLPR